MVRILVFSDTHGAARRMPAVVQSYTGIDAVIFLGDGTRDADALQEQFPNLPLYRVCGNCDFGCFDPMEGVAAFGGVLLLYTHGHAYSVKTSLGGLRRLAKERGADAVLFGHTHVPHYEQQDGLHLFNPGSLSIPRGSGGATYGLITIENETPTFEIKSFWDIDK